MATVLRLKRSFMDDPAEGLVVYRKRLKSNDANDYEERAKYFTFIGSLTDDSSEEGAKEFVSRAVRQKCSGGHRKGAKDRLYDVTAKRRGEQRERSRENRLKLVDSLRTPIPEAGAPDQVRDMYRLYDVIEETNQKGELDAGKSTITCNGVSLVRRQVSAYDLYYWEDWDEDLIQNVTSIEKQFPQEDDCQLQVETDSDNGEEEEDSNDENNWRNDYPDEEEEDYEGESDYYGDYDDDQEEIRSLIESCNVHDD